MSRNILIVDDEAPLRHILARALGRAGFHPVEAASAEDGIEMQRHENCPLLFLDIMLPGMTGVDMCRLVRQDNPIVNIFAMTGHSSLFELADCREAGFDDYFRKPFSLAEMIQAAEQAFARIERWKQR